MKAIKYIVVLGASLFVLNSCTKQEAGPTGPKGNTGPQGNAASYSVTIDSIAPTGWPGSPNGNGAYTVSINNIKALSNPNFSIVEVYASTAYSALSTWQELGVANYLVANDALTFQYTVNQVVIEYYGSGAPAAELYFKIVVINQP